MIVSKIRCYNVNMASSKIKNKNYIIYIAKRAGVDLSPTLDKLNANSAESDNKTYLKYIHERPQSHGLFGNISNERLYDVDAFGKELYALSECRNIYRGIASFEEGEAIELGFDKKKNWEMLIRATIPDISKQFSIPIDQLEWVAAFHKEKGHPHIHYMFWHKGEKVQSNFIHSSTQGTCREILSKIAYSEIRPDIIKAKNQSRDALINLTKDYIPGLLESGNIPEHISRNELNNIASKLQVLLNYLPTNGSLKYKYLQPEVKQKCDNVVESLLENTNAKAEYQKLMNTTDELSASYSVTGKKLEWNRKIAKKNIYTRLGNIILSNAVSFKNCDFTSNDISYEPMIDEVANDDIISEFETSPNQIELDNLDYDYTSQKEYSSQILETPSNSKIDWSKRYKSALKALYDTKDFDTAYKLLTLEAQAGNALAVSELAKIYDFNIGIPKHENNKIIATQLYEKTIDAFKDINNNTDNNFIREYTSYRLGKLYNSGKGCVKDDIIAVDYFKKCNNNKYAQYALAKIYIDNDRFHKNTKSRNNDIMSNLTKSANSSNPYAAYALGDIYKEGIYCDIDINKSDSFYKQAFDSFTFSVEQKRDDNLLYKLGQMHLGGYGTEVNIEQAISYFKEAEELNNGNAAYQLLKIYLEDASPEYIDEINRLLIKLSENDNSLYKYRLGSIYSNKDYSICDIDKAIDLLNNSAVDNPSHAYYRLGKIYNNPDNNVYNVDEAIDYFILSAENGNDFAKYQLGKIYANKETPFYNPSKAFFYLTEIADSGNHYAGYQLGKLYSDIDASFYNINKALHYLNLSANSNNPNAHYQLGTIYSDEKYKMIDMNKAINHLLISAAGANSFAELKLGNIYLYGKNGVKKDEQQGLYWLNKALEHDNEYAREAIDFYEKIKQATAITFASRIFYSGFNALSSERIHKYNYLNYIRSEWKQARKEEMLRKEIISKNKDNEHEM